MKNAAIVVSAILALAGCASTIENVQRETARSVGGDVLPAAKRRAMASDALRLMAAELPMIPLYRRLHNWVMRPNLEVVHWPNDVLELRWVRMR